jgi:hypothetical protein
MPCSRLFAWRTMAGLVVEQRLQQLLVCLGDLS